MAPEEWLKYFILSNSKAFPNKQQVKLFFEKLKLDEWLKLDLNPLQDYGNDNVASILLSHKPFNHYLEAARIRLIDLLHLTHPQQTLLEHDVAMALVADKNIAAMDLLQLAESNPNLVQSYLLQPDTAIHQFIKNRGNTSSYKYFEELTANRQLQWIDT